MLVSPLAYDIVRKSGVIVLPSQRTLFDYTHWRKSEPSFQSDIFKQLVSDVKVSELNEAERKL